MTTRAPKPKHQRLIPADNTPSTRSVVYMPFIVETEVDETEEDQAASTGQREHSPERTLLK
jgi:hypothetical protein